MKKLMLVLVFTLSCSDIGTSVKTSAECETYDTEEACINAGCPIFQELQIVSYNNYACGEVTQRSLCWTTENGDALAQGVESCYSRIERDGSRTIAFSGTAYVGLLGWALCQDSSLCKPE